MEHRRTKHFLLGLVVALALFFGALELRWNEESRDMDEEILDELAQDMEMMPALVQKDMIMLPQEETTPPQVIEKVNPVEEKLVKPEPDRLLENQTALVEGDAESQTVVEEETPHVAPVAVDEEDNPLHFRVVERLPEFPGGMVAFMKWLNQNLKYPPTAQRMKIQGTVVVSFIVNKDGTTTDARILRSSGKSILDTEAMRVVRMMPKWKAGEDHGKPCRTQFAIPIEFKI